MKRDIQMKGTRIMSNVILFPTHEDYCKSCIFNNLQNGSCENEEYKKIYIM